MKKNEIKRREFIKKTACLAAGTMVIGGGISNVFGKAIPGSAITLIDSVNLNNDVRMPKLGFGTLYLNNELGVRSVADAISVGYRLIDTATIYGNEKAVGDGIKKSGINRKKLFITSKVWVDDYGYETTMKAFQTSIDKLGTDYLDLYLIHRPRGDVKGTWKAMEDLYKDGRIRAIGLSNFESDHLKELMSYAKVDPAVNQVETHAFFRQQESNKMNKKYGIQHEAWSPLAQGRNGHFTNETLAAIGKKYNKSNAQVSLRWHYQRDIVAIPRSSQKEHMKENLDIFNFELSLSDMKKIASLDLNTTQFPEWE